MAKLGLNWITEKTTDFEYKKYVLLAYLKEVQEEFGSNRLYPCFSELIDHYRNLQSIMQNKNFLADQFPHQLEKIDAEKLQLEYARILEDDDLMQQIMDIVEFSMPRMVHYLEEGRKIYDFIEEHVRISPLGLIPLRNDFGYFFLCNGSDAETRVFRYEVTLFERSDEKYRGLHTEFVTSYQKNVSTTFEAMRLNLLRRENFADHPATFVIESDMTFPFNQSLLPVARRMLIRHLAA